MRVLVTGHLGYIGSVLVPRMLKRNFDVVGVDADWYRRCNFLGKPFEIPSKRIDIRDMSIEDLQGFDAVIHLAGLCNDPLSELNPALTLEINTEATLSLARKAKKAGVQRFVFSSSCSNYGAAGEDEVTEQSATNPVTTYGRSKVLAEQGLSKFAASDFSPVYLRNATVYGLSPRPRFDLVANNLVAWAMHSKTVLLKSQGLAWRPLIHVEDVADAAIAALLSPQEAIHDRALNIGDTQANLRVIDLATLISEQIPGSRTEIVAEAEADARSYRVNCDLALRSLTNWRPRWSLAKGIDTLREALTNEPLTPDDFEGARYARLEHLKLLMAKGELDARLKRPQPLHTHAASA